MQFTFCLSLLYNFATSSILFLYRIIEKFAHAKLGIKTKIERLTKKKSIKLSVKKM